MSSFFKTSTTIPSDTMCTEFNWNYATLACLKCAKTQSEALKLLQDIKNGCCAANSTPDSIAACYKSKISDFFTANPKSEHCKKDPGCDRLLNKSVDPMRCSSLDPKTNGAIYRCTKTILAGDVQRAVIELQGITKKCCVKGTPIESCYKESVQSLANSATSKDWVKSSDCVQLGVKAAQVNPLSILIIQGSLRSQAVQNFI